jgi:hypothetical protein
VGSGEFRGVEKETRNAEVMGMRHVRKVTRKHLIIGDWLICIDTTRGCFDAIFLDRDNRLVMYPMKYVRERVSNELLPYVETAGHFLYFESPDGKIAGLISEYEKHLPTERARLIRKQMYKIVFTDECHKFVNDLMCLEFGVCVQDNQECGGNEPRRIKSVSTTYWSAEVMGHE